MDLGTWDAQRIEFQHLLRQLRQESGLTQAELAQRIGKPQSYVSKYESGERRIDVIELKEVCLACGNSLAEFASRFDSVTEKRRKP